MDLLDRLLGHDRWTTVQLLERCRELKPVQWQQSFDLGHQTLPETFAHMLGNVQIWTVLMAQQPVQQSTEEVLASPEDFIRAWLRVYNEFAALAQAVRDEGRWDAL